MNRRPRNSRYWLDRLSKKRTGLPMATLAYYGPDSRRASKAVVGLVLTPAADEPREMRKWLSDTDVRDDIQVIEEMVDYLEANQIERLVTPDRIVGCPHEEGIDYPDGEVCPECPYWANRNRFTGELLS